MKTYGTSSRACTSRVRVQVRRIGSSRIDLRTDADAPGWLVLSELDFPGWVATVDNRPLPIHRANAIFRAVCVPAGQHTVRFAFHPWRMVADAWRLRRQGGGEYPDASAAAPTGEPRLAAGQHAGQRRAQQ